MKSYLPVRYFNNNKFKNKFNSTDNEYLGSYITYYDMLDYAKTTSYNNFLYPNSFSTILFSNSINNITPTQLNYLVNVKSDIQTQIDLSNASITSNTNSIQSNLTKINSLTTQVQTNTTNINTLSPQVQTNTTNINTLTTQVQTNTTNINLKATDSGVVHNTMDETINGVKNFTSNPTINLIQIATIDWVNTQINNLINSSNTALQTLNQIASILSSNTNEISTIVSNMMTPSGNYTITGLYTFVNTTIFNTLQATNITFSGSLNSIPSSKISYLSDLTSSVQQQLNNLLTNINTIQSYFQNYLFDNTNQYWKHTTGFDKLTTQLITTNKIITNDIISNNLKTSNLYVGNIYNTTNSLSIPYVFINNSNVSYPIISSGLMSDLNLTLTNSTIHIAPNYSIMFLTQTNILILTVKNNSTQYKYNISFQPTNQMYYYKLIKL